MLVQLGPLPLARYNVLIETLADRLHTLLLQAPSNLRLLRHVQLAASGFGDCLVQVLVVLIGITLLFDAVAVPLVLAHGMHVRSVSVHHFIIIPVLVVLQ